MNLSLFRSAEAIQHTVEVAQLKMSGLFLKKLKNDPYVIN